MNAGLSTGKTTGPSRPVVFALVLLAFVWPVYTEKTVADGRENAART